MKLQDLSINRKLMLITMLTSSVALILLSAIFLWYDLSSFRRFPERRPCHSGGSDWL